MKTIFVLIFFFGLLNSVEAQKGEKSIAAGILTAFPANKYTYSSYGRIYNLGVGLEGIGQYNFTEKSAALVQLQFTRFSGKEYYVSTDQVSISFVSASLKGGYRYQIIPSGFYSNVLAGVEQGGDGYLFTAAAMGIGNRFTVRDVYFIDAGLDYTVGTINRFNLKAVFSLLRKP